MSTPTASCSATAYARSAPRSAPTQTAEPAERARPDVSGGAILTSFPADGRVGMEPDETGRGDDGGEGPAVVVRLLGPPRVETRGPALPSLGVFRRGRCSRCG